MTDLSLVDQLKAYFLTKKGTNIIQGGLAPATSSTVNLGASDKKFSSLYVENLYADTIVGSGSSAENADTLDGYHAVTDPVENAILVLGPGAVYPTSVYDQALLITGERRLEGNLEVADTVTIDGVDISALNTDFYTNHAWKTALEAHRNGQYGEASLGVFVKAGRGLYNALFDGSTDPEIGHLNRQEIWIGLQTPGTIHITSTNDASGSHTHAITASSSPGSASNILKTDQYGGLTLDTTLLVVDGQNNLVGIGDIPDTSYTLPDLRVVTPQLYAAGGVLFADSLYVPYGVDVYAPAAEGTFNHLTIADDTLTDNLNADYLDGRHGWQYRQSDNYLVGTRGWKLFDDGSAEFENILARGRIDSVVYSQRTISAISGQMLLSVGAKIAVEVLSTDTTITFDVDEFAADDIIQVKSAGGNEYMRVASRGELVTDGFQYSVVRNLNEDPAGPFDFPVGSAAVRRGSASYSREPQALASGESEGALGLYQPGGSGASSGGGWLILDGESPFIAVEARKGPVWNQFDRVVQIGNLVGSQLEDEYPTETWGVVFGDANNYLSYDETNGLRIHTFGDGTPETNIGMSGVLTQRLGLALMATAPDYVDHTAFLYMKNSSGTPEFWAKLREGAATVDSKVMLASVYDSSGLNAVDKMKNQAGSPTTLQASTTRTANTILALDASGEFPKEAYPLALLTDGTRGMTGSMRTTSYVAAGYDTDGQVYVGSASNIEIGKAGRTASGSPFIDFHSSASSPDYDVRLYGWGGDSSGSGKGGLTIYADSLVLQRSDGTTTHVIDGNTAMTVVIDGVGGVPTTGYKVEVPIPFPCKVTGWSISADQTGSVSLTLVKWTNANYRSSSTSVGTASLSSAIKGTGSLNTDFAENDFFGIEVGSASTLTRVTVTFKFRKITGS